MAAYSLAVRVVCHYPVRPALGILVSGDMRRPRGHRERTDLGRPRRGRQHQPRRLGYLLARDSGSQPDLHHRASGKRFHGEGLTVAGWIRQRRLECCRRDLEDPALAPRPVAAIAAGWGFSNAGGFFRVFRAAHGLPPAEYRRLARVVKGSVHARTLLVNIPDPAEVLAEMTRLARPGGWVAGLEGDGEHSLCNPAHPAWDRHSRRTIRLDLVRPIIVKHGIAGEAELDELDQAVREHLADPDTLVMPFMYFMVWGRKPGGSGNARRTQQPQGRRPDLLAAHDGMGPKHLRNLHTPW
jgi:hypothetical protein